MKYYGTKYPSNYIKASNNIDIDDITLYLSDKVWRDCQSYGVYSKPGSNSFKLFGKSYRLIIESDTAKLYKFDNRKPVLIDTLQITPGMRFADVGDWILQLIY